MLFVLLIMTLILVKIRRAKKSKTNRNMPGPPPKDIYIKCAVDPLFRNFAEGSHAGSEVGEFTFCVTPRSPQHISLKPELCTITEDIESKGEHQMQLETIAEEDEDDGEQECKQLQEQQK